VHDSRGRQRVGVLWLRDQDGPTTRLRAATYQLTRSEVDADRVDALRDSLLKRSCDTAAAVLMLVLLIPLMLFIALAIKIESPGPVIYRS
jgi:lipopolysaccharide/colanic/teichoic acid biosynthesis glycosyltransferase